jgi:MFS family permease
VNLLDETDLNDVKVGQDVDLYVDGYPNTTLTGKVDSLGLATAGTFSLLPSSNSSSTVQWLSTGYMLTNGVFIPITPFLISKLGTRKLLILAMSAFTKGSFVCSISTGFSMLMVGRVIQAAGAGVIMPLLMTVFLTIKTSPRPCGNVCVIQKRN